jgi:hypothetical protein
MHLVRDLLPAVAAAGEIAVRVAFAGKWTFSRFAVVFLVLSGGAQSIGFGRHAQAIETYLVAIIIALMEIISMMDRKFQ